MSDAPFPSRNLFCADLIADSAGCLASGLAGRLAFAAASVLCRLLNRFRIDRNDVFSHDIHLAINDYSLFYHILIDSTTDMNYKSLKPSKKKFLPMLMTMDRSSNTSFVSKKTSNPFLYVA